MSQSWDLSITSADKQLVEGTEFSHDFYRLWATRLDHSKELESESCLNLYLAEMGNKKQVLGPLLISFGYTNEVRFLGKRELLLVGAFVPRGFEPKKGMFIGILPNKFNISAQEVNQVEQAAERDRILQDELRSRSYPYPRER